MSYTDHKGFQAPHGWKTTAYDQVWSLNYMSIPELKAVIADRDLAVTVRKAAERTMRKFQRAGGNL